MLTAGAELAFDYARAVPDESVSAMMAHIRLTDVAERATELSAEESGEGGRPITTGSLYQIWPNQPAFQTDLLLHVIGLASFPGGDESLPFGMKLVAEGASAEEALRRSAFHDFLATRDEPVTYVSLLAYTVADNAAVREALASSYEDFDRRIIGFYELLVRVGGRRMRAPLTAAHLASTISALIEGFMLRYRADPDGVPDDLGHGLSLLDESVLGIWEAFTEPA
ncbi:MAG: TetR family transcriptional regulator C-terminal domain-containing protein [Actinomycetota bacterium]|nr:TetR family transcriptional regulator C-terminal domain-containing protein [Actinomycetota bacterium]